MTKPKDFYNNVIQAMNYLDTMLPPGSHVLLTGLANGSLLFQSIGENIYPIGRVKNDVKYSDVYTYLSCLQVFTVFSFFNKTSSLFYDCFSLFLKVSPW